MTSFFYTHGVFKYQIRVTWYAPNSEDSYPRHWQPRQHPSSLACVSDIEWESISDTLPIYKKMTIFAITTVSILDTTSKPWLSICSWIKNMRIVRRDTCETLSILWMTTKKKNILDHIYQYTWFYMTVSNNDHINRALIDFIKYFSCMVIGMLHFP